MLKKRHVEHVHFRCEELQLELAASLRGRPHSGSGNSSSTQSQSWGSKGTEIDRIMAKIEQDNRILAELDHSRSTTLGKFTSICLSLSNSLLFIDRCVGVCVFCIVFYIVWEPP